MRYTPEGKEERRIALPARKITSLAFGGANYTDIYATSAGGDNRVADRLAGSLFRLNAGISGVPEFFSRVRT